MEFRIFYHSHFLCLFPATDSAVSLPQNRKDMALTIYTDIPDTCYSSQLQKIEIETDAASVLLTITHQASTWQYGNGLTQIFQSEYATHNDSVTIYDIGSFLEAFMAQMDGLQRFIFIFVSGSTTITRNYTVICCKHQPILSAADLAGSNYLTNYLTRLVYRGTHDQLPYFADFGLPGGYTSYTLHYTVFYRTPNGTTGTYETDRYGRAGYGVSYFNTSPETVYLLCKDVLPQGAEILSYTLRHDNRIARFFVTEQTVVRQLIFRNSYGCLEYLCIPTARTEKAETKSSIAVCADTLTPYDITHTRTFEEQTPVLQRAEARRFGEFLTSAYTAVLIDKTEYPILITDYDFSLSDTVGEGNTVKFSWQFASLHTPLVSEDYTRIFSPEHTKPFT